MAISKLIGTVERKVILERTVMDVAFVLSVVLAFTDKVTNHNSYSLCFCLTK